MDPGGQLEAYVDARSAGHVLGSLGQSGFTAVRDALDDPHPGVRRQAIRLAEITLSYNWLLVDKMLSMTDDPDATPCRSSFAVSTCSTSLVIPMALAASSASLRRWTAREWRACNSRVRIEPRAPRQEFLYIRLG